MKRQLILMILVLSVFVTGCSYKKFEDSIKAKISSSDNQNVDMETLPEKEIVPDLEETNIYHMGEEMKGNDGVDYIVKDVQIVDNIYTIGLSDKDFNTVWDDSIDSEGNIAGGDGFEFTQAAWYKSSQESMKYKLLLLDIHVTKVKEVENERENDVDLDGVSNIWPSIFIGTGKGIQYGYGINLVESIYLSSHLSEKNYHTFNLSLGEEKDIQMGWILPEDVLDEEWYYVVDTAYGKENYKYCKLDMESDENAGE